mgnify:CR=1 FL=1
MISLPGPCRVASTARGLAALCGLAVVALGTPAQADDDAPMQMMRLQPTHLPGMRTRDEVVARYLEQSGLGDKVVSFDFYLVFGVFRLAGIVQQIYYRYFHKQTTNKRFASFVHIAAYLETRCEQLIAAASAKA